MIKERIQDTDFFILREFSREIDPCRKRNWKPGVPPAEYLAKGKPIVQKYVQRLMAKGHSLETAKSLLQDVFVEA
jgi:hypothetical protein